jgi:predicted alternative tryptophan synthase beta-subunit
VRVSHDQKPYRKFMMETWGGTVNSRARAARPTSAAKYWRRTPKTPETSAIAISDAVEEAATNKDVNYSLGSVLNHVCMHQTIIGLGDAQAARAGRRLIPTWSLAVWAGARTLGHRLPVRARQDKRPKNIKILAVEPSACPTHHKGRFV